MGKHRVKKNHRLFTSISFVDNEVTIHRSGMGKTFHSISTIICAQILRVLYDLI